MVWFIVGLYIASLNPIFGQPLQWFKQFSGNAPNNFSYGMDMVTDQNGNTYVVGSFFGQICFGGLTINAIGVQDFYIAKFNISGEPVFVRRVGHVNNGQLSGRGISLHVDGQNNIFLYVTGFFGSYTGQVLSTNFNQDGQGPPVVVTMNDSDGDQFVAKYNAANLECSWAKLLPNTSTSMGSLNGPKITSDNSGNAYVINDLANHVVKYNTNGTLIWSVSHGLVSTANNILDPATMMSPLALSIVIE
jgi:outer membrane protein assembly factor BamB